MFCKILSIYSNFWHWQSLFWVFVLQHFSFNIYGVGVVTLNGFYLNKNRSPDVLIYSNLQRRGSTCFTRVFNLIHVYIFYTFGENIKVCILRPQHFLEHRHSSEPWARQGFCVFYLLLCTVLRWAFLGVVQLSLYALVSWKCQAPFRLYKCGDCLLCGMGIQLLCICQVLVVCVFKIISTKPHLSI